MLTRRLILGLAALGLTVGAALAEAPLKQVRAGAVTVSYRADGRGDLLVLLPSMGRSGRDFDEIVPDLTRAGFRVLRPEPRGIGGSTGPMTGLTLADLAQDVALVVEHEGGPSARAVIVGHAFGNFVARKVAMDHPRMVRGVVVAAAASKNFPAELRAAVAGMGDMARPPEERLKLLRYAMFAPGHDASGWLTGWYPTTQAMQRAAADATPSAAWWSAGAAPILELQSAEDPFKPAATRGELSAELGLDRVTVVLIPNASHALFPEQPRAAADAVTRWARALPR